MPAVVALDAGTSSIRALAIDESGTLLASSYRELSSSFPRPGWVEQDPREILRLAEETLSEVCRKLKELGTTIAALGLTNQRETALCWDRRDLSPYADAIVWQDRRTAERCHGLEEDGMLPLVRERTGLVLDSYFSAPKWEWMLTKGGVEKTPHLALGTVDSFLSAWLTGRHATDVTNACRTLLFDITRLDFDEELCDVFGVERELLGEVVPTSGRIGTVRKEICETLLAGVPLSSIAGDQQASLFGHGCTSPGDTKATYGTGTFALMTLGKTPGPRADGLLTSVAWQLGATGDPCYLLEGSVFTSGAALSWLAEIGLFSSVGELGTLAASAPSTEGLFFVPAFAGLGSPWWDPGARAAIGGISRGVGRKELARAAVEAIAFQARDVLDAMSSASGLRPTELKVDGGASQLDLLCQLQADQCQCPVLRAPSSEMTALGAAYLAGIAEGLWTTDALGELSGASSRFEPSVSRSRADREHDSWLRALEAARS